MTDPTPRIHPDNETRALSRQEVARSAEAVQAVWKLLAGEAADLLTEISPARSLYEQAVPLSVLSGLIVSMDTLAMLSMALEGRLADQPSESGHE